MTHPITGIDHLFLLVRDLAAAATQYERLGFTVSPRGEHSDHMGTANHTIMLENDYLELLGVRKPTPNNAAWRAKLENGEGPTAVACRVADARAAVEDLRALGLPTTPATDFERPVTLPDGGEGRAAFTVAVFDPEVVPHGEVFLCQHHTRDTVWLPALMHHANGASALGGLVAAVDEPAAVAGDYARLFAAGVVTPVDGGVDVATGSAPVTFLEPAALARRYPGLDPSPAAFAVLQIVTRNLEQTRSVITANDVPLMPTAKGFAVPAAVAAGAIVEFIGA